MTTPVSSHVETVNVTCRNESATLYSVPLFAASEAWMLGKWPPRFFFKVTDYPCPFEGDLQVEVFGDFYKWTCPVCGDEAEGEWEG